MYICNFKNIYATLMLWNIHLISGFNVKTREINHSQIHIPTVLHSEEKLTSMINSQYYILSYVVFTFTFISNGFSTNNAMYSWKVGIVNFKNLTKLKNVRVRLMVKASKLVRMWLTITLLICIFSYVLWSHLFKGFSHKVC